MSKVLFVVHVPGYADDDIINKLSAEDKENDLVEGFPVLIKEIKSLKDELPAKDATAEVKSLEANEKQDTEQIEKTKSIQDSNNKQENIFEKPTEHIETQECLSNDETEESKTRFTVEKITEDNDTLATNNESLQNKENKKPEGIEEKDDESTCKEEEKENNLEECKALEKCGDQNSETEVKEQFEQDEMSSGDTETDTSQESEGDKNSNRKKDKKVTLNVADTQERPKLVRILSHNDIYTLKQKVAFVLDKLKIKGIQWQTTEDNMHIAMFICNDGLLCERVLNELSFIEVGIKPGSSVSVFPASVSIEAEHQGIEMEAQLVKNEKFGKKLDEFKKSVKARLVVHELIAKTETGAQFTFDFFMLILLASLVAFMGLIEASSVVLVASMLISPLMGPILAVVLGVVIKDNNLAKLGCKNELRGLLICVLVGLFAGFIPSGLERGRFDWRSTHEWPTLEMSSRGTFRGLVVGVLIAIPSGAGVAFSILGKNVGSLIGVAISASLLPPAVNAGLLWSNAIIVALSPFNSRNSPNSVSNASNVLPNNTKNDISDKLSDTRCLPLFNNEYLHQHYCNTAADSAALGAISLTLTILNIFCIIVTGVIILKAKEVKWKHGVHSFSRNLEVEIESYQTAKGKDALLLKERFRDEYKKVKQDAGFLDKDADVDGELNDIIENVQRLPDFKESSFMERLGFFGDVSSKNPYHTFHGETIESKDPSLKSVLSTEDVELRQRGSRSADVSESESKEANVFFAVKQDLQSSLFRSSWRQSAHKMFRQPSSQFNFLKISIPGSGRFQVEPVVEQHNQHNLSIITETDQNLSENLPLLDKQKSSTSIC